MVSLRSIEVAVDAAPIATVVCGHNVVARMHNTYIHVYITDLEREWLFIFAFDAFEQFE